LPELSSVKSGKDLEGRGRKQLLGKTTEGYVKLSSAIRSFLQEITSC